MYNGFQKILVPVYSTIQAYQAVKRAIEWADAGTTEIHVVKIQHPFSELKAKLFGPGKNAKAINENWSDNSYTNNLVNISSSTSTLPGLYEVVELQTSVQKIDLVVLPVQKKWSLLTRQNFSARLAASLGIPVLRVGKKNNNATSVVLPVQQGVDNNILEKISVISRKNPVNVHLVAYKKEDQQHHDDLISVAVLQAYQWLRSYVKCPVEFSIITGASATKAVNNYLHQLDNDVLLLQ